MAHSDAHRLLTFADLFCGIGGFHAAAADGQLHYIAVIAAGAKHAKTAIRNAGFLSRFTGQPAHAVVAAMKMGDGFEDVVASGGFHWICLDKRDYD